MQPEAASVPFDPALRERIEGRLASIEAQRVPPARGAKRMRRAAVAFVVVGDEAGEACFVLTRRASGLRRHSGQWAIPGGRMDEGETPADAAPAPAIFSIEVHTIMTPTATTTPGTA